MTALVAEGVEKRFVSAEGALTIRIERLTVEPGQAALLLGASGSGKSTALALVGGVMAPSVAERLEVATPDGVVDVGAAWRAGSDRELRALHARDVGFVLQTGGLIPFLTLRENIAEAARLADLAGGARRVRPVEEVADLLGIGAALDLMPRQASVGQRQRAALARAVVHGPAILLADEPSAALDFANADAADRLILDCVERFGVAALIATHRPDRPHWRDTPRADHRVEAGQKGPVSVFTL